MKRHKRNIYKSLCCSKFMANNKVLRYGGFIKKEKGKIVLSYAKDFKTGEVQIRYLPLLEEEKK